MDKKFAQNTNTQAWGKYSPFGVVLTKDLASVVIEANEHLQPAILNTYPFLLQEQELTRNFIAQGLGYDVFALGDYWVLKFAANRHPDVRAASFLGKQVESFHFLRKHLGTEYVCPTLFFQFPFQDALARCEIQLHIAGKALGQLTNDELRKDSCMCSHLIKLFDRILEMYSQTRRMPDLIDNTYYSGWMHRRPFELRNVRYTGNIRFDSNDYPKIIDIGAWKKGFSADANLRALMRCQKIARDLKHLRQLLLPFSISNEEMRV